jgi:hypothetical protein
MSGIPGQSDALRIAGHAQALYTFAIATLPSHIAGSGDAQHPPTRKSIVLTSRQHLAQAAMLCDLPDRVNSFLHEHGDDRQSTNRDAQHKRRNPRTMLNVIRRLGCLLACFVRPACQATLRQIGDAGTECGTSRCCRWGGVTWRAEARRDG